MNKSYRARNQFKSQVMSHGELFNVQVNQLNFFYAENNTFYNQLSAINFNNNVLKVSSYY